MGRANRRFAEKRWTTAPQLASLAATEPGGIMNKSGLAAALAATISTVSPASAQKATSTPVMTKATALPAPPRAEQRPYSFERHGVRVEDNYAWLRDKGYP